MSALLEATEGLSQRVFGPNEVLANEGAQSDEMFVLVSGVVEVLRDETVVAILSEPGSVIGEMSALLDAPYSATVRARETTTVRVVDGALRFLEANPAVTREIAAVLARRLHLVTTYLADLRRQYGNGSLGLSMVDEVLSELMNMQGRTAEPGSERAPDPNL